jgi:hypothetical protein
MGTRNLYFKVMGNFINMGVSLRGVALSNLAEKRRGFTSEIADDGT